MKKLFTAIVLTLVFISCTKDDKEEPDALSINNTTWMVEVSLNGKTTSSSENIFEFSKTDNTGYFSWSPVGATTYRGNWTQDGTTVNFTFDDGTGQFWDCTGTLSKNARGEDNKVFTGTMTRRNGEGLGSFRAVRP